MVQTLSDVSNSKTLACRNRTMAMAKSEERLNWWLSDMQYIRSFPPWTSGVLHNNFFPLWPCLLDKSLNWQYLYPFLCDPSFSISFWWFSHVSLSWPLSPAHTHFLFLELWSSSQHRSMFCYFKELLLNSCVIHLHVDCLDNTVMSGHRWCDTGTFSLSSFFSTITVCDSGPTMPLHGPALYHMT